MVILPQTHPLPATSIQTLPHPASAHHLPESPALQANDPQLILCTYCEMAVSQVLKWALESETNVLLLCSVLIV